MKLFYNQNEIRKDRYFVYTYNTNDIRIVKSKKCLIEGFEKINNNDFVDVNSDEVQRCSLSRTKRMIRELCLCNDFEYFATLTINSEMADRYSLDSVQDKLKKTLKKIKRKNKDFRYLFITERHKDRCISFSWSCKWFF